MFKCLIRIWGKIMRKDNIMKQNRINKGRLAVSLLAVCLLATQSLQAKATDITGVTGNNGIYNINPTDKHGDVGFRQYNNFNLSEGDIANLIFKYGAENVSKFVNLVDNQVNINGIVNSMRDGKFYNGQAIFISPKGLVVGASGVINVGSLSVLTPTQSDYNKFKEAPTLGYYKLDQNNADVTINGKVITREGAELSGKNVIIGANAGLIAGIKNNDVIKTNSQADVLFNNLVNTSVSSASSLSAKDGKIVITSYSDKGGTQINGTIKNFAENGKVNIGNKGADGLKIAGTVENKGDTLLVNNNGALEISGQIKGDNKVTVSNYGENLHLTTTGKINNKGDLSILNSGSKGLTLDGSINTDKNIVITNNKGNANIAGTIASKNGKTNITNNSGSLNISGTINNNNTLKVWNTGANGTNITGTIANNGSAVIQNDKGEFRINGTIANAKNADIDVISNGTGLNLDTNSNIKNNGSMRMWNKGANGIKVAGNVENNSKAVIQNYNGKMEISGNIANVDTLNLINNGTSLKIANGSELTNTGTLGIQNTGNEGLTFDGELVNAEGNTVITNTKGNFYVSGNVNNQKGKVNLTNKGDALKITSDARISNADSLKVWSTGEGGTDVKGQIVNNGNAVIQNDKGDMTIDAQIYNGENELRLTNKGNAMKFAETNTLVNGGENFTKGGNVIIYNTGKGGMQFAGKTHNDGEVLISNQNGKLEFGTYTKEAPEYTNNGKTTITSKYGLETNGAVKNNGEFQIINTGNGDLALNGTFENTQTSSSLTVNNQKGAVEVNGIIANNGKAAITANNGLTVTKNGTISNTNSLTMLNKGDKGLTIAGTVDNNGSAIITNKAGELKISGTVNTEKLNDDVAAKTSITNQGTKLTVTETGVLNNSETLNLWNKGSEGTEIAGTLTNKGDALIKNDKGSLDMTGNVENEGSLRVQNNGTKLNASGSIKNNGTLSMLNNGTEGFVLDGTTESTGSTTITNNKGNLTIKGKYTGTDNKLTISSKDGITVEKTADINNQGSMTMLNTGANGLTIDGTITNNGNAILTNMTGDMTINGTVTNNNGKLNVTSRGNALNVNGKIDGNGILKIWSTGEGGTNIAGAIENETGNAVIQNDNGEMNISGTVTNNADKLYITNHGTALNVTETGRIQNKGNVAIWNTAEQNMNIKGSVSSTEGRVIKTNSHK